MSVRWLVVPLVALAGCRGNGGLDPTELGFKIEPAEVDFGRVLEGDVAERKVTVSSFTRVDQELTVAATVPFGVTATISVPGASSVEVPITFRAGSVRESGTLTVTGPKGSATTTLLGTGVRPLVCVPSARCRSSTYDLASDRCLEATLPDGASCQPDSVCLEKGQCRTGQCEGVPRSCDDNDRCTDDGCSPDVGCVHVPRSCPAPANPCKVATCDPSSGCGEANGPDFGACGTVNCISANLCVQGVCSLLPTPEGFVCGPATPCQGESHCRSQKCVAPDASYLAPKVVVPVPGDAVGPLLAEGSNVFFATCEPRRARGSDAGLDGGFDGGPGDGGDAGEDFEDAGCVLLSYTATGFDRFRADLPRGEVPVHVALDGVGVRTDGGFEVRHKATGAVRWSASPGPVGPRAVAVANGRVFQWLAVLSDGGHTLVAMEDGGLSFTWAPAATVLALEEGVRWLSGDGVLHRFDDAGQVTVALDGGRALISGEGVALRGGRWVVRADGGARALGWDAGEHPTGEQLLGGVVGLAYYRDCAAPLTSCMPSSETFWVQAFSLVDGTFLWRAQVAEAEKQVTLLEAALLVQGGGSVAQVHVETGDAGSTSFLDAYAFGKRVLRCELRPGTTLERAVFTPGALLGLARVDGGLRLETYELRPLEPGTFGWPRLDGVGGTRTAR